MKLNLGCGSDIKQGYVNVDFRQLPGVDRVHDLSIFPWPFEDGSADEILMLDFLEHFPYRLTQMIMLECYRVLKPDGELVVQVPDGRQLSAALAKEGRYLCNRCGTRMYREARDDGDGSGYDFSNFVACPKSDCQQTADDIAEAAMMRLYGGQDYAGNFHQTCFTQQSLFIKAARCGFMNAHMEEVKHQEANWNLKMRLTKGDVW